MQLQHNADVIQSATEIDQQTIAVFGSAFNPPSLGHRSVLQTLGHFDKVLLVPSISHAWGKTMLDYELRCQMVQDFIHDVSSDMQEGAIACYNLELSQVEHKLVQPDQSVTTFAVMTQLQNEYPQARLTFVIGPDNFLSFERFYRAKDIMAQWSVLACPETLAVRSTDIRQALKNNQPIEHLTTPSVAKLLAKYAPY